MAALPGGYRGERGARVGMQFFHDAADIVLDRALGKVHRLRDLTVAQALGYQLQYLFGV